MVHQEWLKPRKILGLVTAEFVVGEKLRCQPCRASMTKLQRAVAKRQTEGQQDIRDYLEDPDATRYAFTVSTTSPAFRSYFHVMDFPSEYESLCS
jgi:hypothetical protein